MVKKRNKLADSIREAIGIDASGSPGIVNLPPTLRMLKRASDSPVVASIAEPKIEIKFKRNETIRHHQCGRLYLVKQTPATCVHNETPSYMLEQIGLGPKTAPFYRSQKDVEELWEEVIVPKMADMVDSSQNLFGHCELIEMVLTKARFVVVGLPQHYRIASTGEAAYAYQGADGVRDVMAQSEMEDGRFIKINKPKEYTNDE